MAKTSLRVKQRRPNKYPVRNYNRCQICGRRRGFLRRFGICRICVRVLAARGDIPGLRKASW